MKPAVKLALAVAVLSASGAMSSSAETITVVSRGGAYTKAQVHAMHRPFTAATGHVIESRDYAGGLKQIRAQVKSGKVTWSVVDVEPGEAARGCREGLFARFDHSKLPPAPDGTPASEDFINGGLAPCAVATVVWSTVIAYDKSKLPEGPKSMADFFDMEKFPGSRGLRKSASGNLEMALFADGVAAGDIYTVLASPEGVERALAKLDTIKASITWWTAGAQPQKLLSQGKVVMTSAYNGQVFNSIAADGKPFAIVWDGQLFDMDFWAIPKGAPNMKIAREFVAFATDTQRLADQAAWISYGPARKSSDALVGTYYSNPKLEMAPLLPTHPANFKTAIANDFQFWAANKEALNKRFKAWLKAK
jgi:putative spermidine/putrescine transport system substrate-binding protein